MPAPQLPEPPRVRELSRRLEELIRGFQREFPMTPAEIREALRHAGSRAGAGRHTGRVVLRTLLFWIVVIALPLVVTALIRALR